MKSFILLGLLCLFIGTEQLSTPADDSYVAAVVEYEVSSDTDANLQNYITLIQDAADQNADIIVFPELTLDSSGNTTTIPIHGLLKEYSIPALHPDLFDPILVAISAAARNRGIYVVINIREKMDCNDAPGEDCPEKKVYKFNTNVVFDHNGAVIDRYRKINLFGEYSRTPALTPELGRFTTEFGVTFGHFICFDLMFQVPAVQLVQKYNITDVIFPTMWFSEMPYLTAVQIQEAYAYALDVNFLASGANNVAVGSAGSGIFSGKAGALISIMPGVPTTKLLVARVPKVPGQVTGTHPGPIYDNPSEHDNLLLKTDPSLTAHTSRLLVPGYQDFVLMDGTTICRFKINMTENSNTRYRYRAAVLDGVRTFDNVANGGARSCAVIACTEETMNSCGRRFAQYTPNSLAIFEELAIEAFLRAPQRIQEIGADDVVFYPVSMQPNIMPLEPQEYSFETTSLFEILDIITYSLVNKDAELYSFGFFGRVFDRDGDEVSPPVDDSDSGSTTPPTPDIPEPEPDSDSAIPLSHHIMVILLTLSIVLLHSHNS